ncbi:amylo-alpha-1,6-glucosidase [Flavobacterium sp.]
MKLTKEKSELQDYNKSIKYEWLETNGLGGFASATIIGTNTRRYHGLLIAALDPPVNRISMLSKLDETVICGNDIFELGCNNYNGAVAPQGFRYLKSFSKDLFPEWHYQLPNGVEIKKTIAAIHGENTTIIMYQVLEAAVAFQFDLLPLVSARDFHSLTHSNQEINQDAFFENSVLNVKPYHDLPQLFIAVPNAKYHHNPLWYYNFEYPEDLNRGQEYTEDLFSYGRFSKLLSKGDTLGIIISTDNPKDKKAFRLFKNEKARRKKCIATADNSSQKILHLAADQFIVNRGEKLKTIIAGYPWFTDWGRDAMIALPGLCLSTGRFADAKDILSAFMNSVDQGMIPNCFPNVGQKPEYNSVDATLWFFIAIKKYLETTGDKQFVLQQVLPVMKNTMDWYHKGTHYAIHVATDGFLEQGTAGEQLTWMDAKIGTWVVTPRTGKAVEITALWYNALLIYADILKLNNEKQTAKTFIKQAERIKNDFTQMYWNEARQCLFDCINQDDKDPSIRPNQLFALCLPFPLLAGKKAASILKVVTDKLYTPVGLRSLSPDHPDYKGTYSGNEVQRDEAYHQGTVWSWLLGPYIEAIRNVKGAEGEIEVQQIVDNFNYHFTEACIGSISEIFDGDAPHKPRGAIAQAWSVAELLRVINRQ